MVKVDEDEDDIGSGQWPQCQRLLDDGFEMWHDKPENSLLHGQTNKLYKHQDMWSIDHWKPFRT